MKSQFFLAIGNMIKPNSRDTSSVSLVYKKSYFKARFFFHMSLYLSLWVFSIQDGGCFHSNQQFFFTFFLEFHFCIECDYTHAKKCSFIFFLMNSSHICPLNIRTPTSYLFPKHCCRKMTLSSPTRCSLTATTSCLNLACPDLEALLLLSIAPLYKSSQFRFQAVQPSNPAA